MAAIISKHTLSFAANNNRNRELKYYLLYFKNPAAKKNYPETKEI